MEILSVKLEIPEGANIIVGQTHFIKTVEDVYEIMVTSVPGQNLASPFVKHQGPALSALMEMMKR